ncbi:hypothetical protein RRG08_003298 [Elysia crispata]|uniref:Uncharacterized protein n=1 Tax=Elysia crispata TaxID=231223 RepID=A0AAE1DKW5_9GAST|nr:hypothetical protein RRG08_003298 [Elysia crispata]
MSFRATRKRTLEGALFFRLKIPSPTGRVEGAFDPSRAVAFQATYDPFQVGGKAILEAHYFSFYPEEARVVP